MKYFFSVFFTSLIAIFGIIGNLLCFAVFSRRKFKKISLNLLFRTMCITDTLFLIQITQHIFATAGIYEIRNQSVLTCKLFVYITYMLAPIKGWILVFIGVER